MPDTEQANDEIAVATENDEPNKEVATSAERQKRPRKQTQFFKPPEVDKTDEVVIKEGQGLKLGDIPNVQYRLAKTTGGDELIESLHFLLYKKKGKAHTRKKDVSRFSGFPEDGTEAERKRVEEKLGKWTLPLLHQLMDFLDVPRGGGDKAEKVKKLTNFLEAPEQLSDVDLEAKEAQKKAQKAKKSKKRKAPAAKGSKSKKSKDAEDEDDNDEEDDDEEEEEEEEEPEEKVTPKKRSRTPAKTSTGKKATGKKSTDRKEEKSKKSTAKKGAKTKKSSTAKATLTKRPRKKAKKEVDEDEVDEEEEEEKAEENAEDENEEDEQEEAEDRQEGEEEKPEEEAEDDEAPPMPEDDELIPAIRDIMKDIDPTAFTLKMLLQKLSTKYPGVDFKKDKKAIQEKAVAFLEIPQDDDAVEEVAEEVAEEVEGTAADDAEGTGEKKEGKAADEQMAEAEGETQEAAEDKEMAEAAGDNETAEPADEAPKAEEATGEAAA